MPIRQLTCFTGLVALAFCNAVYGQAPNPAGQPPAPADEPARTWSIESLRDLVTPESAPFLAVGAVTILALFIGLVLFRIARWLLRVILPKKPLPPPPNLEIDVVNLASADPQTAEPKLEIYGIPSVVVAVVVAPSGREAEAPPKRVAFHLLEAVTPGFGEVLAGHQPLLAIWPAQLSSQGFAQLFFSHARLPGDAGRGTHWTSTAGKVQWKGKSFLVGIIFRAEKPLELGQRIMEHAGQWVEMLRVRR
jgi:hypothetical protein